MVLISEYIIKNGLVIDGSDNIPHRADVHIVQGRIRSVGVNLDFADCSVIDAKGLVVCPGFIDTHRHMDAALLNGQGYGGVELRQGITTAISGNCGFSLFPYLDEHAQDLTGFVSPIVGPMREEWLFSSLGDYAQAIEAAEPMINCGAMIGNGSLRIALNGFSPGALDESRMERAESLIQSAMRDGAFGLSMGLMYAPENEYRAGQLIRLARALNGHGVLAMHIRGEGKSLMASVEEALHIGMESGARLQISHFKAAGRVVWGEPYREAKALIEQAIANGQDVRVDVYPYEAGSTSLLTLLPPAWLQGGLEALMERLAKGESVRALQAMLESEQPDFDNIVASVGFESIRIASVCDTAWRWVIGRDLTSAANEMGVSEAKLIAELICANQGNVSIINFIVSEENLADALCWDKSLYISDSILSGGKPHPRYHGAFAKMIRKYVREDKLLDLGEAIRRMTYLPARRYGIFDRGWIAPGQCADVVVIDPNKVQDEATYEDSERLATGFEYVIVNGEIAVQHDRLTDVRCGEVIRPMLRKRVK